MVAKRTTSRAAKPVAKSVSAVGASGGSAVADIRAAVGTSTSPSSTGTKAVTGVGFQPKVLMPFGVDLETDESNTEVVFNFGAGVSPSNVGSINVSSVNNAATSRATRQHKDDKVLAGYFNTAALEEAELSSFDSDGFTFNWTKAIAQLRMFNHICLGGDDLEASLTLHQMNGTNADESFAHGLTGGAPDALLFFGISNNTPPANTATHARISLGSWADGNEFYAACMSQNGLATTLTRRTLGNTASIVTVGSVSVLRAATVSNADASNVDVSYNVTSGTTPHYFFMLALRGCKAQVGTFDCNGSTDPLTISTPGITPKLFLPVWFLQAFDLINTVGTNLYFNIGASDGTNTVSCGITDGSGLATTNSRRLQNSSAMQEINGVNGATTYLSGVSFDGNSVVVDPTQINNGSWGQGAYLVIGN